MKGMKDMNELKFERTHKQAKERKKFEKQVFAANCVRLRNAWALNDMKKQLEEQARKKRREEERLASLERSVFAWNSYTTRSR